MAVNFKIATYRNSESLHLKLMGDFDGTSACKLVDVLEKNQNGAYRVIIHTNCLNTVYPLGRDTFQKRLNDLNGIQNRIFFTGEEANYLAPEKTLCI